MIDEQDKDFMESFAQGGQGKKMLRFANHLLEEQRAKLEEASTLEDLSAGKKVIYFIKEELIKPLELGSYRKKNVEKREYL